MPPCAKPDTSKDSTACGLAVILVFLSHKGHVLAVDVGKLGVWTFFLISGFLIVGELHRNRQAVERDTMTRRHALALFLAKRALRIFPVYYLLLAALAIAHALFYQRGVNLGRVARGVPVELLDRRRQGRLARLHVALLEPRG